MKKKKQLSPSDFCEAEGIYTGTDRSISGFKFTENAILPVVRFQRRSYSCGELKAVDSGFPVHPNSPIGDYLKDHYRDYTYTHPEVVGTEKHLMEEIRRNESLDRSNKHGVLTQLTTK